MQIDGFAFILFISTSCGYATNQFKVLFQGREYQLGLGPAKRIQMSRAIFDSDWIIIDETI